MSIYLHIYFHLIELNNVGYKTGAASSEFTSQRRKLESYQRTWLKAEDMQSIAIADMQR